MFHTLPVPPEEALYGAMARFAADARAERPERFTGTLRRITRDRRPYR